MEDQPDILSFDELVNVLRFRLRDADALNTSELHSFKELMKQEAEAGLIAENWYWDAYDELEAMGHLDPASGRGNQQDAHGRLSADGRAYRRELSEL